MTNHLRLIKNKLTHKDRMQARIDSLKRDLLSGDGDMLYVEQVLDIVFDYMSQFEDEDVFMSALKIKEATFFIANFNHY